MCNRLSIWTKLRIWLTIPIFIDFKNAKVINKYLNAVIDNAVRIYTHPNHKGWIVLESEDKRYIAVLFDACRYWGFLSDGFITTPDAAMDWEDICPSKKIMIKLLERQLELEHRFDQVKLE